ncbi:hypothetical protein FSP39_016865 [Pinctada imbricata]|uniref:Uncharacterized protein n=1 Tax=Pinctada imbricata TaxID=66713 RepID=A0AA89BV18_PINIB|nr:hypothetical protein FSP39_016865 [Pinctada imbricata]
MSYNTFDADTLKKCKRSAIRPMDPRKPIEGPFVPVPKDTKAEGKTVQPSEEKSTEKPLAAAASQEVKEKVPEKTDIPEQPTCKFKKS